MYGNNINKLMREKEKLDDLINSYQTQSLTPSKDLIEWRILNENEEVDNLYVQNKTLFISDNMMILKGVDGKLDKWKIQKTWPIDKKDEKINQLEEEIKKLKEVLNEYTKPISTIGDIEQSNVNDDVNVNGKSKTSSKSISK